MGKTDAKYLIKQANEQTRQQMNADSKPKVTTSMGEVEAEVVHEGGLTKLTFGGKTEFFNCKSNIQYANEGKQQRFESACASKGSQNLFQ
mmetsp:Transcript_17696/g.29927  ORF Transcript_17696/g.29927 Transcript_17696/m.29927 type:complete len:90 (+) Transcript_17696:1063-1332(+)